MNESFYYYLYKILKLISYKLAYTVRYLLYRKAVLEPENLILLKDSEQGFIKAVDLNHKLVNKTKNTKPRIGILGSLSNSLIFSDKFWEEVPSNNINLYLYEFLAKGYIGNKKLSQFQHTIIKGFYYKNKIDRIYKDTFDYKYLSKIINNDNLDMLLVSIETLGRFTYGKLFNELITTKKIVVLNAGNTFYVHPKVTVQSQIQLPPCWEIKDNKLINSDGYIIDDYKFINDLFFYDKRDIVVDYNIRIDFENIIFIHGRLSKIASINYLELVSKLLLDNPNRKFIFMGPDDLNSLAFINSYFEKNKLISQIKYLGSYSQSKDENGKITDENWNLCKEYLKKSAVYLNPFPKSSGSSRVEAFASGLPVIDFEIDYMNCKNKNKKAYILEPLIKKYGTAYSENEYLEICKTIFIDKKLRKDIILEQYKIIDNFCDEKIFWNKILNLIEDKN